MRYVSVADKNQIQLFRLNGISQTTQVQYWNLEGPFLSSILISTSEVLVFTQAGVDSYHVSHPALNIAAPGSSGEA